MGPGWCWRDAAQEIPRASSPDAPPVQWRATEKRCDYGFDHATQDWVFQTDSDRQHLPSDFWKLWEKRQEYDFVLGVRSTRADGPVRVFITTVMRLANLLIWGLWIRDANCPFKLMRRKPMETVMARIPRDSFIPMVMFSMLCRKMPFRVAEVMVTHLPRRGGEQSLSGLWKWIKVGSKCLRQIVDLRMSLLRGSANASVPLSHR